MAVSAQSIKISDIRLLNPPISWKEDPKLEIKIKFINKAATDTQRAIAIGDQDNNRMTWNEPFIFAGDITDETLLTFTVQSKRALKNIIVGSCQHLATDLLEQQGDSGLCNLDIVEECQLAFNIEIICGLDVVSGVIEKASTGLASLPTSNTPAEAANAINSVAQVYNDNEKTWMSFLDTFQAFMKVMDGVSEINIYVQVAWSVLSIIPKTIIAKKNRDDKVKQLCENLKDVYKYILQAKPLCELPATQTTDKHATHWFTILSTLIQQTIECAYFLKAYGTESTAKNIIKAIGGKVDDKIQAFNDKLDHLMKVMTDSVILETSIVTLRVSEVSEKITEKITEQSECALLGEVPYDSGAGYYPNKECLPGTRQRLIEEIFDWATNDSSMQILVLSGQAGTGKSAIAHSIAKMLKRHNRLGSMFCFNRSYADRRNRLFSTISRNLADGDIMWRKELVKIIGNDSDVRKKEDVRTQFNELIIKPSQNMATDIGPIVIVVDALDESGDREERGEILEILLNEWTKLPKNYRIIVTTRPEQDIEDQCRNFRIPCKRMGDIDMEETRHDIQAYVSDRLAPISSKLDNIRQDWRYILAKRAEGLFQWAQTACRFINPTTTRSQLIKKKWETCISNSSSSLYGLYRQIISNQSEAKDGDFVEDFKVIVGAIITARVPLSIKVLQEIFDDIEDIKLILTPFGSFFVGVHDSFTPVRPVHTSLFDFFTSKKNAEEINEYFIDTSNQSRMTLGCLGLMNRMLCFNICQLETSHRRNQQVPNFNKRVKEVIPFHLSYSCCFWAFHLRYSPVSGELIHEARRLMDDKLLYYFEVLSLLGAVDRGSVAMREIADWCKDVDGDLAADAMNTWRFGVDFGGIMMESTPHLYLSVLPLAPRDSFVSKRYLERYPGLFAFDIGQPVSFSRTIGIAQTFGSAKIAFSPKDPYIATGSSSGEFSLRNYITGEHLSYAYWKPKQDDALSICDVVYSFDGELVYCCLRNSDILVWNVATKEMRIERYGIVDHNDWYFDCTISSNGRFIIWERAGVLVLFDRISRRIIKHFDGNEYSCCAISPNGNWIALHNSDKGERYIWDTGTQTQHYVIPSWRGTLELTDNYIAFQPDSTTIVIWDLWKNTKLTEIRHEEDIQGPCISPDDQYLLATSNNVYLIWGVSTGELISRSYGDQHIECLGFSHDSKSIALRTLDSTLYVRQWDKFIEPNHLHNPKIQRVSEGWLRGSCLILRYDANLGRSYLRISDITTINTIIFETELECWLVSVSPDEETIRVAYISSRGLCLWGDKEGEIVVDESVRSVAGRGLLCRDLELLCLDNYLISAHERIINIWDTCTRKLICGPIEYSSEVERLHPVRGTRFAVIYDHEAEIRDCESGGRVGETFFFTSDSYPYAISVNEKHVIYMSNKGVYILEPTGARVGSISFSTECFHREKSLDGKYMAWIDHGEIKLFDVDTETLFTDPSLDHPARLLWFSNDSKRIIIKSGEKNWGRFLDIWDIQSKTIVTKTIRCPPSELRETLLLSKRCLVVIPFYPPCYVWDLGTYETMSTLYDGAPPLLDANNSGIEGTSISSTTETLDYALMAWKKASLPAFTEVNYRGWVLGLQGELLFWIPPKKEQGFSILPKTEQEFWFPCVIHMPHRNIAKLNFTNFVHGSNWTKCKSGNN